MRQWRGACSQMQFCTPLRISLDTDVRRRHVSCARSFSTCRLRNRGGFNQPPQVPSCAINRARAIELLGHFTQRRHKTSSNVVKELLCLLGKIPSSKELAQQWKATLTHIHCTRQKSELCNQEIVSEQTGVDTSSDVQSARLPHSDASTSHAFSRLGAARRLLTAARAAPISLEALVGKVPQSVKEAKRMTRELKVLQRARRKYERYPPCGVEAVSDEEIVKTVQILGLYAARGHMGKNGGAVLKQVLRGVPRNSRVAGIWKKELQKERRLRKKREAKKIRRAAVEYKRQMRRERLEKWKRERGRTAELLPPPPPLSPSAPAPAPAPASSPPSQSSVHLTSPLLPILMPVPFVTAKAVPLQTRVRVRRGRCWRVYALARTWTNALRLTAIALLGVRRGKGLQSHTALNRCRQSDENVSI